MTTPRGIRNNNPGNIVKSAVPWVGKVQNSAEGVFETFDTPEHGIAALCDNLLGYQTRHGLRTVRGIISRWSATDQDSYIARVSTALGVAPDDVIDLTSEPTLIVLVTTIIEVENGQQPYPPEMIAASARHALGLPDPVVAAPAAPTQEAPAMPEILGTIAAAATVVNPIAGLGLGLLNSLIDAFTPLAKQKMQAALDKHGADPQVSAQLVDSVLAIAKTVTGKADAIEAVVDARGSPVAMQAIEAQSLDKLDELAPLLDKVAAYQKQEWDASEASMDAAAARGKADDRTPDMAMLLSRWAVGATSFILVALFTMALFYAWRGAPLPEMLLTLIVQSVTGVIGFVALLFTFRFGSSRSSGAKDELVAQLATRRK